MFFVACFFPDPVAAQPGNLQQLKERMALLQKGGNYLQDTAYINTRNRLAFVYANRYPDSAIALLAAYVQNEKKERYKEGEVEACKILGTAWQTKGDYNKALDHYQKSYQLAQANHDEKSFPGILNNIGLNYLEQGNYGAALSKFYEALKQADERGDKFVTGRIYNNIANVHFFQGKMDEAETDYRRMLQSAREIADTAGIILAYNNIGEAAIETKRPASALAHFDTAYALAVAVKNYESQATSTRNMGKVYLEMDSLPKAVAFFTNAYQLALRLGNKPSACKALIGLAKANAKMSLTTEALKQGLGAVELARQMGQASLLRDANETVSSAFEGMGNGAMALQYYKQFKLYSDSLRSMDGERLATRLKAEFDFSRKELEFDRKSLQQRWLTLSACAGLIVLLVIIWFVNRIRKREKQSNVVLQQKNEIIESQKVLAEKALVDLKATQQQLLHQEKMASLGELTAGIAHEIQNPLNFVNNFSAVNQELLAEMKEEISNKNYGDVLLIAADVEANEEKIVRHGKRAEAIVKGMLLHSRGDANVKEPTDINALAEEYLRLSYRGIRARDPSFQASLQTAYDAGIGEIKAAPQEIGRVLLNLFNNAFYAINEKKKRLNGDYEPTLSVSTKRDGDRIFIFIRDNGTGMPLRVAEKIFQPFFTTKPPGEGTGLGLSLSYDVVTKQHGGKLSVQSKENEGTEFVVELPVQ